MTIYIVIQQSHPIWLYILFALVDVAMLAVCVLLILECLSMRKKK